MATSDEAARAALDLLSDQHGVVARVQLTGIGVTEATIQRLLRRRELVRVHTGVYVDHTGPLSWRQRAWAAVLACAPAALGRDSALRAVEGPGRRGRSEDAPIHVLIGRNRRLVAPAGVVLHRVSDLEERVAWSMGPPRDSYDAALLDVALDRPRPMDRLAVLSSGVQQRRTTARRLAAEVDRRSRVPDRGWLQSLLLDLSEGACSVLEHGYLARVERAHGLSGARRQVRDRLATGVVYRDVEYDCADGATLVVELDGRLHHDTAEQRDRDLHRDLLSAQSGKRSVRLGWGQVFDRPCATAAAIAGLIGRGHERCADCETRATASLRRPA